MRSIFVDTIDGLAVLVVSRFHLDPQQPAFFRWRMDRIKGLLCATPAVHAALPTRTEAERDRHPEHLDKLLLWN